jgi:hypothetical protein
LIKLGQKKQTEWFKIRDTAKWIHQTTDKGVDIHYITSVRDKNCFKASGVVDFPPWVCYQVMTNSDYRQTYDINVEKSEVIEHNATNLYTIYQASKTMGVWPAKVESRDFVLQNYNQVVSDFQVNLTFCDSSLMVPFLSSCFLYLKTNTRFLRKSRQSEVVST